MRRKTSDNTLLAHTGSADLIGRTVGPPIQKGSTVLLDNAAALYSGQVAYGRVGLQPHASLIEALCDLEHAATATLHPSGLAAMTGAITSLVSAGDEILAAECVYAPTRHFCDKVLGRLGVTTRYFAPDAGAEQVAALCTDHTRLIVLESPGSLTFEIQDVPAIAAFARTRGVLTLIDNTWGAGVFYKPLDLGVDVSVQALTKYACGHSDVFCGAAMAADSAVGKRLADGARLAGVHVSPDDVYQSLRGLRTLTTRLAAHEAAALEIAGWLARHPKVREIICPGFPGSRGHDLWKRDFTGQNGLLGLILDGDGAQFIDALELFGLGYSWGGFESLAIHGDPQLGARTFKPDFGGALVRLHIGLEDPADLIADLEQALAKV